MTITPNIRYQASVQLITTPSSKQAAEGQGGASATNTSGHGFFGGGLRGTQGLGLGSKGANGAVAGLICEDNTVRTSYDSTLTNLKILKKKCIPRDHVVILPVSPTDVKNRIAASLQLLPAAVDTALHQAIFSLCEGQSFWLGEMIIHMLERGIVDFTAQLQAEGLFDEIRKGSRRLNPLSSAVDTLKRG